MEIWINLEMNDGMAYPSTHLTQQGCLVEQIENVLEYLDSDLDDDDPKTWHDCLASWGQDEKSTLYSIDITQWRSLSVGELWRFRDLIVELTWDTRSVDWYVERTQVKP